MIATVVAVRLPAYRHEAKPSQENPRPGRRRAVARQAGRLFQQRRADQGQARAQRQEGRPHRHARPLRHRPAAAVLRRGHQVLAGLAGGGQDLRHHGTSRPTTDTGDTEGLVIETRAVDVTLEQIEAVLEQFRGPIAQVPPMYSALKRDGKPLYEYARAGITLEREARNVTIHKLELISYDAPFLKLSVKCSKGTYIRVLGQDIGEALGCGAHLNALRRTQVGALTLDGMITLDDLFAHAAPLDLLAPVDALLASFPAVQLTEELAKRFLQGQRLALGKDANVASSLPAELGRVRVYLRDKLLGTAHLQEYAVLAPERLIATAHQPAP